MNAARDIAEQRLQHIETSIGRLFEQDIAIARSNTDTVMAFRQLNAKLDGIVEMLARLEDTVQQLFPFPEDVSEAIVRQLADEEVAKARRHDGLPKQKGKGKS